MNAERDPAVHESAEPAARSVSSEVEVAVSPETAFRAFTDEMNLWWVRGPINFFDAARAVAQVCEPGVGGRILEVYDRAAGDVLELARITAWQPGELLAWRSSVDDVRVEVTFSPVPAGTQVRVVATIPAGGQDRGGTAWVRVTPAWFGAWCARRGTAPAEPADTGRLALAVHYAKPVTAARWLAAAFGFSSPNYLPESDEAADTRYLWIEFLVGNCSLIVLPLEGDPSEAATASHVPWVFVDDLDAHFATAQAAGARIVEPIHQHGYRAYQVEDLEGNRWIFAQARPTMR
jgi:uncharacterized glyoxalase superfamily protein PhnB/uncharacterized protein YndB with AHSA1/START domain